MTEDEKKEFEEFLEWKAEKKRKEQGRRIKLNFPSTAYLSSPHSIPLSVVLD